VARGHLEVLVMDGFVWFSEEQNWIVRGRRPDGAKSDKV
jgi:hypothetical protein